MIKLEKTDAPEVLVNNEVKWRKVLEDKIATGETPTSSEKSRYRHPEIKKALVEETSGKCAYCESKLLHIAFGDVEHIVPKSLDINNIFRWENLTLACDKCNTYKSDEEEIIDPYKEDPGEIFEFLGPLVVPHPGIEKAVFSEKVLKLNRAELTERRTDKIKYLSDQLTVLKQAKSKKLRAILHADLLNNEMDKSQEFAATARSFLNFMLPKIVGNNSVVTKT